MADGEEDWDGETEREGEVAEVDVQDLRGGVEESVLPDEEPELGWEEGEEVECLGGLVH